MRQEWHQSTAPQTPIVLVCSTDENYAMPMTVMAYSALHNLKNKQQKLLLFVIDGGVRPVTKRRVARSLNSDQIEINWIQPNRSLQDLALTRYLTTAAYNRLLLPDVLPQELDKAIYLDCDMVVCGDLGELWQIEIDITMFWPCRMITKLASRWLLG